MTKEEVIMLRDRLKMGKDAPLGIIGNNLVLYSEDKDVIHWDDVAGIVNVIRSNTNQISNSVRPYEICAFTYADVQDLRVCLSEENMGTYAMQAGFDHTAIEAAKKRFGVSDIKEYLK